MNFEKQLSEELKNIELEISIKDISPSVYELISLLNRRILLSKKIHQLKWNKLSIDEMQRTRKDDLITTEKFYAKYGEDVEFKFLYKKAYYDLVEEIRLFIGIEIHMQAILIVLLDVLNSCDYINIKDNVCISAIFKQIENYKGKPEAVNQILSSYYSLCSIPFEIK